MEGPDITSARVQLGEMWRVGRPLSPAELSRVLGLSPRNGSDHVNKMEQGKSIVSGPLEMLIRLYLAGAVPPDDVEIFKVPPAQDRADFRGRVNENRKIVEDPPADAVTAQEAASILGLNANSLAAMRSQGIGPVFCKVVSADGMKASDRVYYERAELERYMEARPKKGR